MKSVLHVARRELAARWVLLPAAIAVGALAMIAIQSIGHVRGDADSIMNGTWVGTLVVSTIVGMSLLGEELTNSRLSFYFARPFSPHAIFGGKLAAGVLLALFMQVAIMILVALALPELSWRGSALARRDVISVGGERILATVGCTLLGFAASIALGSKSRWFLLDILGIALVGVIGTWFALQLEPDPYWLPADSIRSAGEKALFHAAAFFVAVAGLGAATVRALVIGRTDRMRAHRMMSTTLWPVVIPAMVVLVLIADRTTPGIPDPPAVASNVLAVPEVAGDAVIADEHARMPYLLVVEDSGQVRVGAAASWTQFDEKRVRLSRPATLETPYGPYDAINRFITTHEDAGTEGELAVASVSVVDRAIERAVLRGAQGTTAPLQIPQSKSTRRGHVDLAGQASLRAYAAGVLGLTVDRDGPGFPRRHAWLTASTLRAGRIGKRPLVLAAPAVKAAFLIDAVYHVRASIAVARAGKVRPLRLTVRSSDPRTTSQWVEARVSRDKIMVEAVPSGAVEVIDLEDLAAAIVKARAVLGFDPSVPVDVLVDDDVDSQRFIDILTTLEVAGVQTIGMGHMPKAGELALRGHRIATTSLRHRPNTYDDSMWFRLKSYQETINRCYDVALVDEPELWGDVKVALFVESDGRITSASASGMTPQLAACVADAFRAAVLPKQVRGAREFQITFLHGLVPRMDTFAR